MIKYQYGILQPNNDKIISDKKGNLHNDIIWTFDIEVSSFWRKNNTIYTFNKQDKEWFKDAEHFALCYIWQSSIDGIVYYGRELTDFLVFCKEVNEKYKGTKYCYIHNLAYEFQFLCNIFEWDNVFARSPHKVMKCNPLGYDIEFRCSYFLTRLSLENWGKKVGVDKKTGQLDYNILRTPLTKLNEKELEYCEYDCLVVDSGIKQFLNTYKHIYKIPLTQTGEVRLVVKDLFKNDYNHKKKCSDLLPNNLHEYAELVKRFRGGDTHANYLYAGTVIENVKSKDESSAYPSVMVVEKYPMSRFKITNTIPDTNFFRYMLEVELYNVESIKFCNYISCHKCEKDSIINLKDNGKVIEADFLHLKIIDTDWNIIQKCYKWTKCNILSCYESMSGYLPLDFVNYVIDLYADKTTLKGIDKEREFYTKQKEKLNSLYGMLVTAILQDNILFSDGEWQVEEKTESQVTQALQDLKNKVYKNFTAYQWGLWVTGYARQNLWLGNGDFNGGIACLDKQVVYYDTDSIKYIGDTDFFDDYNKVHLEKLETVADLRGFDINKLKPKDKNGVEHPCGLWENDGSYEEFITLGAKRYAYRENGELHITVSGVNKKSGVNALKNDINNFNNDLLFDYDDCGKLVMTYLNDMPSITLQDGYTSNYKYGINARPTTYKMSLTDDYIDLIDTINDKPHLKILGV